MIAYRRYPLFGRTLRISTTRSGKDLKCICTEERPDLACESPNWMFDERYCAGMSFGAPLAMSVPIETGKGGVLVRRTMTLNRPRVA